MARLTFRADDELVRQLEEIDSSQSEVMREALRQYLSIPNPSNGVQRRTSQKQANSPPVARPTPAPNIHVHINLHQTEASFLADSSDESSASRTCGCGKELEKSWTFCPTCGQRAEKQEL